MQTNNITLLSLLFQLTVPPASWPHSSDPFYQMLIYNLRYLCNYMNAISFVYCTLINDQSLQVKRCTDGSMRYSERSINDHMPVKNYTSLVLAVTVTEQMTGCYSNWKLFLKKATTVTVTTTKTPTSTTLHTVIQSGRDTLSLPASAVTRQLFVRRIERIRLPLSLVSWCHCEEGPEAIAIRLSVGCPYVHSSY